MDKIGRPLDDAGWRYFDDARGLANIDLEPNTKITETTILCTAGKLPQRDRHVRQLDHCLWADDAKVTNHGGAIEG